MTGGTSRSEAGRVQVYYDGACPVCSREIAFYRSRPDADGLVWIDASRVPDAALGPGLARDDALSRMHVRQADGRLVTGAAAFAVLWRQMRGFRWLGHLLAIPPVGWCAEQAYRLFLALRPLWRPAARP